MQSNPKRHRLKRIYIGAACIIIGMVSYQWWSPPPDTIVSGRQSQQSQQSTAARDAPVASPVRSQTTALHNEKQSGVRTDSAAKPTVYPWSRWNLPVGVTLGADGGVSGYTFTVYTSHLLSSSVSLTTPAVCSTFSLRRRGNVVVVVRPTHSPPRQLPTRWAHGRASRTRLERNSTSKTCCQCKVHEPQRACTPQRGTARTPVKAAAALTTPAPLPCAPDLMASHKCFGTANDNEITVAHVIKAFSSVPHTHPYIYIHIHIPRDRGDDGSCRPSLTHRLPAG